MSNAGLTDLFERVFFSGRRSPLQTRAGSVSLRSEGTARRDKLRTRGTLYWSRLFDNRLPVQQTPAGAPEHHRQRHDDADVPHEYQHIGVRMVRDADAEVAKSGRGETTKECGQARC
jgi:hypothetical protein